MSQIPDELGAPPSSRYYPPRGKLLLLSLGSAVFVLVGLAVSRASIVMVSAIGWLLFLACAAGTLVILARALRPGPTLTIDADGVVDRTALAPAGRLRWDEITVIRKKEVGRGRGAERLLEVVLADPDGFAARPRSLLRRLADRYRRLLKQPQVSIPGSMVNAPIATLIEDLRRWQPELQVLELPPDPPPMFRKRHQPSKHPTIPRW